MYPQPPGPGGGQMPMPNSMEPRPGETIALAQTHIITHIHLPIHTFSYTPLNLTEEFKGVLEGNSFGGKMGKQNSISCLNIYLLRPILITTVVDAKHCVR